MIKVMQLIHGFNTGGAETVVKNYALLMDKEKYDLTVLCIEHRDSPYEKILKDAGIKVIYTCDYFKNKLSKKFGTDFLIRKIIRDLHPDIIHVHLLMNHYVKFARPNPETKIFYTQHYDLSRMTNKESCLLKWIIAHYQTQLIAINDTMQIELNQRFSVSNTAVIKNGIYLEDYKKSVDRGVVRRKEKIPEDAFVIVHVGRFAGVKNHDFLVDVFEQIKKKNKKAYLLMIGSGETEGKVRAKLNEKKLDGSYTILHNRTDVAALLKASDAAVFPSNTEGLGIAVIEMQAAGLPIVASCGVPKLTQVSNYITYVDLKQGAEYWADELMRLVESTIDDKQLYVDSWDVKSSVSELQKLYESSLEME